MVAIAVGVPSVARADRFSEVRSACDAARDEAGREAALSRLLTVEADSSATLRLEGSDRLVFAFYPQVPAENGAVTLDGGRDLASVTLPPEIAGAVLRARAQGKLGTLIAFHLAEGDALDQPCVAVGGGRFLRVRAEPISVDLVVGGQLLARLTTARAEVDAAGLPEVEMSTPTVAGANARDMYLIGQAALALKEIAFDCFLKATHRAGAIAIELHVAGGGGVTEVTTMIDSLHQESVTSCLDRGARALRFPRTHSGGYVTTTLTFSLAPRPRVAPKKD